MAREATFGSSHSDRKPSFVGSSPSTATARVGASCSHRQLGSEVRLALRISDRRSAMRVSAGWASMNQALRISATSRGGARAQRRPIRERLAVEVVTANPHGSNCAQALS